MFAMPVGARTVAANAAEIEAKAEAANVQATQLKNKVRTTKSLIADAVTGGHHASHASTSVNHTRFRLRLLIREALGVADKNERSGHSGQLGDDGGAGGRRTGSRPRSQKESEMAKRKYSVAEGNRDYELPYLAMALDSKAVKQAEEVTSSVVVTAAGGSLEDADTASKVVALVSARKAHMRDLVQRCEAYLGVAPPDARQHVIATWRKSPAGMRAALDAAHHVTKTTLNSQPAMAAAAAAAVEPCDTDAFRLLCSRLQLSHAARQSAEALIVLLRGDVRYGGGGNPGDRARGASDATMPATLLSRAFGIDSAPLELVLDALSGDLRRLFLARPERLLLSEVAVAIKRLPAAPADDSMDGENHRSDGKENHLRQRAAAIDALRRAVDRIGSTAPDLVGRVNARATMAANADADKAQRYIAGNAQLAAALESAVTAFASSTDDDAKIDADAVKVITRLLSVPWPSAATEIGTAHAHEKTRRSAARLNVLRVALGHAPAGAVRAFAARWASAHVMQRAGMAALPKLAAALDLPLPFLEFVRDVSSAAPGAAGGQQRRLGDAAGSDGAARSTRVALSGSRLLHGLVTRELKRVEDDGVKGVSKDDARKLATALHTLITLARLLRGGRKSMDATTATAAEQEVMRLLPRPSRAPAALVISLLVAGGADGARRTHALERAVQVLARLCAEEDVQDGAKPGSDRDKSSDDAVPHRAGAPSSARVGCETVLEMTPPSSSPATIAAQGSSNGGQQPRVSDIDSASAALLGPNFVKAVDNAASPSRQHHANVLEALLMFVLHARVVAKQASSEARGALLRSGGTFDRDILGADEGVVDVAGAVRAVTASATEAATLAAAAGATSLAIANAAVSALAAAAADASGASLAAVVGTEDGGNIMFADALRRPLGSLDAQDSAWKRVTTELDERLFGIPREHDLGGVVISGLAALRAARSAAKWGSRAHCASVLTAPGAPAARVYAADRADQSLIAVRSLAHVALSCLKETPELPLHAVEALIALGGARLALDSADRPRAAALLGVGESSLAKSGLSALTALCTHLNIEGIDAPTMLRFARLRGVGGARAAIAEAGELAAETMREPEAFIAPLAACVFGVHDSGQRWRTRLAYRLGLDVPGLTATLAVARGPGEPRAAAVASAAHYEALQRRAASSTAARAGTGGLPSPSGVSTAQAGAGLHQRRDARNAAVAACSTARAECVARHGVDGAAVDAVLGDQLEPLARFLQLAGSARAAGTSTSASLSSSLSADERPAGGGAPSAGAMVAARFVRLAHGDVRGTTSGTPLLAVLAASPHLVTLPSSPRVAGALLRVVARARMAGGARSRASAHTAEAPRATNNSGLMTRTAAAEANATTAAAAGIGAAKRLAGEGNGDDSDEDGEGDESDDGAVSDDEDYDDEHDSHTADATDEVR